MAGHEEGFKTTFMGGFDKEDVLEQFRKQKERAAEEKNRLQEELKDKEKQIQELEARLEEKEQEVRKLETDIKEKYQSYIDNYETIGKLIYDTEIRSQKLIGDAEGKAQKIADDAEQKSQEIIDSAQNQSQEIVDEAVKEKELILDKAREAAHECLEAVQTRVDEKLAEGKKKYMAVQEELNDIVELLNQVQRRLMQSYKAVHTIINSTPESLQDLSEESEEEIVQPRIARAEEEISRAAGDGSKKEEVLDEEESLDEEDSPEAEEELEEQMKKILQGEKD